MKKYVFTKHDAEKFSWEGLAGWSYSSKEDFEGASAAYFEISGVRGHAQNSKSDRVYFIIEGQGNFIVEGEPLSVKPYDVIIIPKNTNYGYEPLEGSELKMFLVHSPAFDPEAEVKEKDEAMDLNPEIKDSNPELLYGGNKPLV